MTAGGGSGHSRRGVVRAYTVIDTDSGGDIDGDDIDADAPVRVDVATLLSVVPGVPLEGLRAQARRVMAVCLPGVLSVADVSAHLALPGAVTRALVTELVGSGHLRTAAPFVPTAEPHEREFLERVLDGLQRL
jgi:hypothetical protein